MLSAMATVLLQAWSFECFVHGFVHCSGIRFAMLYVMLHTPSHSHASCNTTCSRPQICSMVMAHALRQSKLLANALRR